MSSVYGQCLTPEVLIKAGYWPSIITYNTSYHHLFGFQLTAPFWAQSLPTPSAAAFEKSY